MRKLYLLLVVMLAAIASSYAQAPQISVSPQLTEDEIVLGETETYTLTISNIGNRDLNWYVSGAKTFFSKPDFVNWNLPENQDRITDDVWITRQNQESLYNAAKQTSFGDWDTGSPLGTKWAAGSTYAPVTTYQNFMDLCQEITSVSPWNGYSCYMPLFATEWFDETYGYASLFLENSKQYYDVDFQYWAVGDDGGGGGFSWERFRAYSWIVPTQISGSIIPGSTFDLDFEVNTADLADGIYNAEFVFYSDDPINPEVSVLFTITITGGTPQISVDNVSLNFGSRSIGGTYVLPVEVSNPGTSPLVISSISNTTEFFSAAETELTILPNESYVINVSFMPVVEEPYSDILVLLNNVVGESPLQIPLSGTGIGVAGISYTNDPLDETLVAGTTITKTLTIESTGDIALEWILKTKAATTDPVVFEKADYADWTLVGNMDVITPNVAITRQDEQGIFNFVEEPSYVWASSPTKTLWSFGNSGEVDPADYEYWRDAVYPPDAMAGQPLSMYLTDEDQYIDIMFSNWTSNSQGGGFSYVRDATVQFIDFNVRVGSTNPTESVIVDVIFDATYLAAGEYSGFIVIHTNIPSTPTIEIPVSLIVTGDSEISLSAADLNFGSVINGNQELLELNITNTGVADLEISSITSDNTAFTIDGSVELLGPGEAKSINVIFTPDAVDSFTGILTINSNDPVTPAATVNLLGEGIGSPIILVDTESVTETIVAGATLDVAVSVDNDGPTNLQGSFIARISEDFNFEKVNYADWTLEANQDRITDNVWITRANNEGIFNIKYESSYDDNNNISPDKTLWAWGSGLEVVYPVDYDYWRDAVNSSPPDMVGEVLNMVLTEENRSFDVVFNSWTSNSNGGGFSYTRYEVPTWIKMVDRVFDVATGVPVPKTFTIDATNLYAGEYSANVIIHSNDIATPELVIPVSITVTGEPEISVASPLVFDDTSLGLSSTKTLTISNVGTDLLTITSIANTLSEFTFTPIEGNLTINPGEHFDLEIEFTPLLDQLYEDEVTILSDDAVNPTTVVSLQGLGVPAPIISISTQQITQMLKPDVEETVSIVIENNGLADLNWTIEGEIVEFIKPNLADWNLPENQDRISDNVWITRKSTQGLYNYAQESGYGTGSPKGTQWAFGLTETLTPVDYENWIDAVNNNPSSMIGQDISLWLVEEGRYFDVLFSSYSGGGTNGGFAYTRKEILPDWISFNEVSGIILPGESFEVLVTINTSGLYGSYSTNFGVSSDDTFNPHIPVNVDLQVGGLEPGTPIEDIRINEGFTTAYVDLADAFVSFDSDPLSYIVVSSNPAVVTVTVGTDVETNTPSLTITEVGIGSSTITIRAEESGGAVLYTDFLFTVNSMPTLNNPLSDILVNEGFVSQIVDLTDVFGDLDDDVLEYTVVSDDETVVTVSLVGLALTISEVGIGSSTITITVDDGIATETDEFVFRVNSVPTVANPIADVLLQVGYSTMDIDITNVFADSDDDALTYTIANSDELIVTASIDGTTLTLDEIESGIATITVTANDGFGGEVSDEFNLRINASPTVASPLADVEVDHGFGTQEIDLTGVFADINSDNVLTYTAISSEEGVVTVSITGSTLTVTDVAVGVSEITVTANDGFEGEVTDQFTFTVNTPVGIDNVMSSTLKLYPNPSSGIVTLELSSQSNGQVTFEVYSIVGQLVLQKSLAITEIKTSIDLSSLNPGVYQVRVKDKSGVIGNKAIVINK
ncbi:MAG: hypothetical protein CVT98_00735 [Bacteroidetes bacterium HGW-Bacteroidetes-15]|nr:MAG: hypothetical protein CVT98_00735 [Bacteroidetes bacterium HGW-Bacteroidetes-15]